MEILAATSVPAEAIVTRQLAQFAGDLVEFVDCPRVLVGQR
jgi:hypothetical protein